jgi:AcrR family transcriptional regulator
MAKGEETRAYILDHAMRLASRDGWGGLSIGRLATELSLSKSGLFAHFGSKEALQTAVLDYTADCQRRRMPAPAADGRDRLRALFLNCLDWIDDPALAGGCPIIKACFEFGGRSGSAQTRLTEMQRGFQRRLADLFRACAPTEGDAGQMAFEFRALTLGYQQARYVLRDPDARRRALGAFEALMARLPA